ncbi:MAG: 2-amino-4-hydroxy-6-hydroxymethyldihydropteridine diphosphokinase [Acidimicrobiales bacterium]
MNKRQAFLALGSNLGDREHFLSEAIAELPDVVAISPVYETDPVGGPEQGLFLNLVIELSTDRTGYELLALCREREAAAQRQRLVHWGPRTLDVDVLWIDGETVDDPPELLIPHPRMLERAFVMVPLGDLAPELVPSDWRHPPDQPIRCLGRL